MKNLLALFSAIALLASMAFADNVTPPPGLRGPLSGDISTPSSTSSVTTLDKIQGAPISGTAGNNGTSVMLSGDPFFTGQMDGANIVLSGNLNAVNGTYTGTLTGGRFNPTSTTVTGNGLYLPAANTPAISANGIRAFNVNTVASGVNYPTVTPSATGAPIIWSAEGSDSTISMRFTAKGNGNWIFNNSSGNSGHIQHAGTTAGSLASGAGDCGTSPAIVGNDRVGRITVGTGANGGKCTLTFLAAYNVAPICSTFNETTAQLLRPVVTTTTLALTGTLTAGDSLSYTCAAYQ